MDAEGIARHLPAIWRARLHVPDVVDSTQTEALAGCGRWPDRAVVVSDRQRRGRGRRGRCWHSPPGASLALSMLACRPAQGAWPPALTLALGAAVADVIRALGVPGVRLKWPNDLCSADGKLGGILVEHGDGAVVAGVGLNLALTAQARDAIDQPCADLAELGWRGSPEALAAALILAWDQVLDEVARFGTDAALERWRAHDALLGREVRVQVGEDRVDGVARGIDAQGRLLVERDGQTLAFSSAEVSVRAT